MKKIKNKTKYKIIYIGAGVSTTFGILNLLEKGFNPSDILVIEKGKQAKDRTSEDVMNGELGAGLFSDGKIIESFTQGGIFTPEYVSKDEAIKLSKQFIDYIFKYHPNPKEIYMTLPIDIPEWLSKSPFELKQSICYHIGTNYCIEMGAKIFEYIYSTGVKVLTNTEVTNIDLKDKFITIEDENNKIKNYDYENLIIGTGKSGMKFLNKFIEKNEINTTPRPAQLGVRFESSQKYFENLLDVAYDFKLYKKYNDNISLRTFCTNNYAAYVACEHTFGMKSFNGHAYKDPNRINKLTNFGLMLEVKNEINNPLTYCENLVKSFNKNGMGSSYSPSNRESSLDDTGNKIMTNKVSLEFFKENFGYSKYILDFIEDLNKTFNIGNDYIIYIPEIKYLTNTIEFDNNFKLKQFNNVYIQGDAASSRGIYISALTGIHVSNNFIK